VFYFEESERKKQMGEKNASKYLFSFGLEEMVRLFGQGGRGEEREIERQRQGDRDT
jgi:hypothetical protein